MKKIKPAIIIGFLCMILTISISIQLKTINTADINGTIQLTDSNLKKSLLQWKTKYQDSNEKLEQTDKELSSLRNSTINTKSESDEANMNKLRKYQIMLGTTDVSGEGVTITVADNDKIEISNSFSSLYIADSIVHDGNLVSMINELKAAGAEAISINDKRITDSTCVTCAGNVIQINGEKVGSPFVIKAIGDKDLLYGEMTRKEGTLYKLKLYGVITNISKENDVNIMKRM